MGKEILTLGDIEIKKNKLYHHKSPIFLKDVDIGNLLVCKETSSHEKKTIDTLMVTCIMIKKKRHYI